MDSSTLLMLAAVIYCKMNDIVYSYEKQLAFLRKASVLFILSIIFCVTSTIATTLCGMMVFFSKSYIFSILLCVVLQYIKFKCYIYL